MATLIMLVLFANTNLFSDAMAAVAMNYDDYPKYIGDSDGYRTDYYQQQEQQHQQSTYNNYGYDNNKKISYNTSYEDMKKYSTYPTKDKKYVCQTGQFQGFFVESVEFCGLIVKGEKGDKGDKGDRGSAGIIEFNDTNTYFVEGNRAETSNNSTSRAFSVAQCDFGDLVLNGGFLVATNNSFDILAEGAFPGEFPNGSDGWEVQIRGPLVGFFAHATCFDNPPLRP